MFKYILKNQVETHFVFGDLANAGIIQQGTYNELNYQRIKQICNLLGLKSIIIVNWLRYKKYTGIPAELSPQQMNELVLWLVVQWTTQQGMIQVDIAANSYLKYTTPLVNQGCGELEAIKQWMLHLETKTVVSSIIMAITLGIWAIVVSDRSFRYSISKQ